jgi:hypothetical protein
VEGFTWGPPPVRQAGVINVAVGGRVRAWQGELSGGVITVLGAEAVYRGALAAIVERAGAKKPRLLAIALDNRKGTATLRLRPAERTVRAVNELHEQVEAVDLPKLLAAGGGARDAQAQAQALARRAGDQDCLPGAYLCALAAFPEGTDLEKLSTLFWTPGGAAEAVKLLPIWLADDEIADLRRSLR